MRDTLRFRSAFALLALPMLLNVNTAMADSRATPTQELLPGDPAPALQIGKWMQKGVYDWVQPVGNSGRRVTVIEFWADWCPLSRSVLPLHDRLQARLRNQGIRFLALAEGHAENAQAIAKRLGLRSLAVACDDNGATFNAYIGGDSRIPMPFVVVIEESAQWPRGRVLWKGPAVTYEGSSSWEEGYTSRLDDALAKIAAGRYDVVAAREFDSAKAEARRLSARVRSVSRAWNGQKAQMREVQALAKKALGRKWPAECNSMLAQTLALSAWFLVCGDRPSGEQVSDGLKAIQTVIKTDGTEHASLLHIQARALFESGSVKEAIAAEQRAIDLPREDGMFSVEDYQAALARYKGALPGGQDQKTAAKESEPGKTNTPEPPKAEAKPLDRLTAEQAASDLLALYDHLHLNYAAYDDIAWRLAGEGSSWKKHNVAFLDRIRARNEWPACDLFDLVTEYLKVVHDRHLNISGKFLRGDARRNEQSRPTTGISPFFTGARVREEGGKMVLVRVPGKLSVPSGAVLADVPVIGSPYTVQVGRVYLFPTLPSESASAKEYLLGVLAEPSSAPGPVKVSIIPPSSGTGRQEIELPLHRGRQSYDSDRQAPPWSLDLKPVPVLTVRRMWGDGLDKMPDSATTLRDLPVVVLDLRTNGGGSDTWAMNWVQRFSEQSYLAYAGAAELRRGETDPLRRWDCSAGISFAGGPTGRGAPTRGRAYKGKLFVITGMYCASSGETFAEVASQVPGALLVGENTGGFLGYGNVDQSFTCPHSGVVVRFGRTRFAIGGKPALDGIGLFPDLWLDKNDPVSVIAAYCALK